MERQSLRKIFQKRWIRWKFCEIVSIFHDSRKALQKVLVSVTLLFSFEWSCWFLRIHSFRKHNEHFLKAHCFSQGSEERKMHGVTWPIASYTTRHGWDGSAMTSSPKPFHLLNALHSVHTWQDMPTPWNWLSWQEHIGFDTHKTVPHTWGTGAWADIDKCWWPHPMTLTSTPSINQTHPLSLSFNPHSTRPGMRP